jgi:hypothetical protein
MQDFYFISGNVMQEGCTARRILDINITFTAGQRKIKENH